MLVLKSNPIYVHQQIHTLIHIHAETICNADSNCPLFVYVDGTGVAGRITDLDTYFMRLMAANGYITVSVDYDDLRESYANGCNRFGSRGFVAKSRAIFDINLPNSVANQVCNSDDTVPVDCSMGIATAGYSQGGHISVLARNYNPLVTGNLVLGHGNVNTANGGAFDVSCVNSDQLALPKERRRSIVGANDQFFGRNYNGVLNQVSYIYYF